MVLELAKSAINIKLNAKVECPIMSAFEYCFAAGLAFHRMQIPADLQKEIRDLPDFDEVKKRVEELIDQSDVFETFEYGERLKKMLLECRFQWEMTDQARELFDMGYSEN